VQLQVLVVVAAVQIDSAKLVPQLQPKLSKKK
jgi:hypothetical protein